MDSQAKPKLTEVNKYLQELDNDELKKLGLQLGLNLTRLRRMKQFPEDMIQSWLIEDDDVKNPCWESLATALKEVGHTGIASKIRRNTRTLCSICKRSIKLTTLGNLRTHGPRNKRCHGSPITSISNTNRALCSICKRSVKLTTLGNLRTHGPRKKRCHGSPISNQPKPKGARAPKRKERSETYEDMIDAPPPKKPKKPSSSGFSPRKVYTDILNETTRKEVIKLFESDLTLDIVVIGEVGIGKSTLVNGIIGKEAAPTGDFSQCGITAKTTSYIGNVGSVKICLWDTPGLFDPSHNTVRVMADIKHLINTADLVYLCIDMIPARFLEDAKAIKIIKKLPTMSSDIWDKTVIILTQANVVVSKFSHKYDKEKVEDEYKDKLSKWKEYIRELLPPTNQIPIIPAGYRLPRIIESDEELWISLLWRETCKVIKKPEAQAAFIKASIPRFQNEVKEDRIKEKKLYEQPIQEPAISDRISSFIQGSAAAAAATGIGEAILAACGVTTALNPVGIGILATAAFSGGLYNVLRKKD